MSKHDAIELFCLFVLVFVVDTEWDPTRRKGMKPNS